jgi:hypothetical protein
MRRHADPVLVPFGGRADCRCWSKTFIGRVAYHEPVSLIRHDITGWEPIADQAAVIATPVAKVRGRVCKPLLVLGR